jgi:hypothetical protein
MSLSSPKIDESGEGLTAAVGRTDPPKRKAEPNSGTHMRTKRNRYISLAWYLGVHIATRSQCPD